MYIINNKVMTSIISYSLKIFIVNMKQNHHYNWLAWNFWLYSVTQCASTTSPKESYCAIKKKYAKTHAKERKTSGRACFCFISHSAEIIKMQIDQIWIFRLDIDKKLERLFDVADRYPIIAPGGTTAHFRTLSPRGCSSWCIKNLK